MSTNLLRILTLAAAFSLLVSGCEKPATPGGNGGETPGGTPGETPGGNNGGGNSSVLADEDWYATNFWKRTDRQKMGLRGPVKTYTTPTLPHEDLEFDQEGKLKTWSYYNSSNELDHIWKYTYDSKGRLSKKEYVQAYDNFTRVWHSYEYEYKNEGKFVAASYWWNSGFFDGTLYYSYFYPNYMESDYFIWDLSAIYEMDYMPDRVSIRETSYTFGPDGNLTIHEDDYEVYPSSYDENGRNGERIPGDPYEATYQVIYQGGLPVECNYMEGVIQKITWQANGMPDTFYSQRPPGAYDYDGKGPVEEARWARNKRYMSLEYFKIPQGYAGAFAPRVFMSNSFNENGDIVASDTMNGDHYSEDGHIYHNKYTSYEYDKYGNWVSRIEYIIPTLQGEDAAYEQKVSREITYY